MAGWNDFNVGDGNFKGKLLYNCMESCRLALIERCKASDVLVPKILLEPVQKNTIPRRMWFSEFNGTINLLVPKFVNHNDNKGVWDKVNYQAPSWSITSILTHLNETREIIRSTMPAAWFSQQFKVINNLRWRKFPGFTNQTGNKFTVMTKKAKYCYYVYKDAQDVSIEEAYPEFVKYWNSLPIGYSDYSGDPCAASFYQAKYTHDQAGWRGCEFYVYRSGVKFYLNEVYPYQVSADVYWLIAPMFLFLDDPKKGFYGFEQSKFTVPNCYYLLSSSDFDLSVAGRKYFPEIFNPYTTLPNAPTRTGEWLGGWTTDNDSDMPYFIAKFDGEDGFKFK